MANKFKIGLSEQAWESMRTPEEIAQDEDREAHMNRYCQGAPACWYCQDEKDRLAEDESVRWQPGGDGQPPELGIDSEDCKDINKIGERICGKLNRASALLTAFEWGLQEIIKVAHVVGPLGSSSCPKCGEEGYRRGSEDEGPFWWQCECGEQWGAA